MPEPSPIPVPTKPVALVIPWFGRELYGGAERHAWEIASRLARRGYRIEAITALPMAWW